MRNKRFRYLSHTADVEFAAYGKSFKSAFENAALALLNIQLDLKKIGRAKGEPKSLRINEKARNHEELVWFALQDILSKRSSEYLNAFAFRIDKLDEKGARLKVDGRLLYKDIEGDYTLLDVKAVTPHDLAVVKDKNGWRINVTVDV